MWIWFDYVVPYATADSAGLRISSAKVCFHVCEWNGGGPYTVDHLWRVAWNEAQGRFH